MPGTSAMAHCPMSAPAATTGHVLSSLVIVRARTSFGSIAPMSTQPVTAAVASVTPYAASLLPK